MKFNPHRPSWIVCLHLPIFRTSIRAVHHQLPKSPAGEFLASSPTKFSAEITPEYCSRPTLATIRTWPTFKSSTTQGYSPAAV
jgi:hypothetical protein